MLQCNPPAAKLETFDAERATIWPTFCSELTSSPDVARKDTKELVG
jgi:hypothetical protein